MRPDILDSPLFLLSLAIALAGAGLLLVAFGALARARGLQFLLRGSAAAVLLALGIAGGLLAIGTQGYRALTHEEVAARIVVTPDPQRPRRFTATFRFPDGREAIYELAGDEILVDARILKWTPWANILGLHTAYELDRVGGRYHAIADERAAPRTLFSLGPDRPVDLFALRRRHAFLAPLVDAQYGSATFVPVQGPAALELRVSTTGLLLRPAGAAPHR